MENKIAQAPEHTTNLIRMEVNQIMLEAIKEIKNKPLPKPLEFTTKEEYQRAWNQYQHQVIQYVKNIKTNIFHQALANYDGVTDDKKEIDELTRKQRMITESITTINDSRVKREVIKNEEPIQTNRVESSLANEQSSSDYTYTEKEFKERLDNLSGVLTKSNL